MQQFQLKNVKIAMKHRGEKRSGLKAPAEPSCRAPTYIVYFFKFILGEDFS